MNIPTMFASADQLNSIGDRYADRIIRALDMLGVVICRVVPLESRTASSRG
jgi:hypothetical protein